MEELEEDTIYFAVKSNLTHRIEIDLKKNSMRNDDRWHIIHSNLVLTLIHGRHVAQFWQQVSPGITLELAEDWAYGVDMDVFGYNIDKYFEEIGMPGYLDN